MVRLHEVIEVQRPIADVFRWVADFSNIDQWDPSVPESHKTSLGAVGEGTNYEVVVMFGPNRIVMDYQITEFQPPNRVVLKGTAEDVTAVDTITFEETASGTRIEYIADLEFPYSKILDPVMQRYGRKALRSMQRAFEDHPEPKGNLGQKLMDHSVLPGMLSFSKLGYKWRKRKWEAITTPMTGRTVVITGATSGLGLATAKRLAGMDASLILVGRNAQKLAQVQEDVIGLSGNSNVVTETADLSRMDEIRSLATRILDQNPAIHVLVNNAGCMLHERLISDEGFEQSYATNLLGHFLLTHLLLERMKESEPARIINISSGGMYTQRIQVDQLQHGEEEWNGTTAYANHKRGQVIVTEMLAEQLQGTGVVVNSMHPGWADTPALQGAMPQFRKTMERVLRNPEQGADTIVWLAAAPEVAQTTGNFWLDRTPRATHVFPGTRESQADREALWAKLEADAGLQS